MKAVRMGEFTGGMTPSGGNHYQHRTCAVCGCPITDNHTYCRTHANRRNVAKRWGPNWIAAARAQGMEPIKMDTLADFVSALMERKMRDEEESDD